MSAPVLRGVRPLGGPAVDLVIDGGPCGTQPSTVIDLTEKTPTVLRAGKGSLAPFVVERV